MPIKVAENIHGHVPTVHWDTIIKQKGKLYYRAEVTDNAGTHGILLDKEKVHAGEIEVRSLPRKKAKK
ncbi:MAG: hypothetical protein KKF44_08900 [Nanoarchaeota archaeon]|nr:hypothetical protein [Nanoarchaeota archaeon]